MVLRYSHIVVLDHGHRKHQWVHLKATLTLSNFSLTVQLVIVPSEKDIVKTRILYLLSIDFGQIKLALLVFSSPDIRHQCAVALVLLLFQISLVSSGIATSLLFSVSL